MGAKFSARECIPLEYIEEQMREYANFDHLRANAEFLNWFVKDYMDNAMADYECEADTPQTDCETCRHYKLACELFSEICKYEPITQTKI